MQFSRCQGADEGDKSGISARGGERIEEMTSGVKRRCATNNENELRKRFSSVSAGRSLAGYATYVRRMAAVHNSFALIRGGEHESLSSAGIIVFAIKTIETKRVHPRFDPPPSSYISRNPNRFSRFLAYPLPFRTATLLPSGDIIGAINVDAIIHESRLFSQVFPSFEDASLRILPRSKVRKNLGRRGN